MEKNTKFDCTYFNTLNFYALRCAKIKGCVQQLDNMINLN